MSTNDLKLNPLEKSLDRPQHLTPYGIMQVMSRDEALKCVAAARVDPEPINWMKATTLASALHIVGDSRLAMHVAIEAVEMERNNVTLLNLAVILEAFGMFQDALDYVEEAVRLDPTDQFSGLLWAQGLLRQGRWSEGWAPFFLYSWCRQWEELREYIDEWNGEDLTGKSILVIQGGGFGDNLMFMRWIGELKKRGAKKVSYALPDWMMPLFRLGHPWIDEFVPTHESEDSDQLPEFDLDVIKHGVRQVDYFCPLMKLPGVLGATVDTIPWDGPYIAADMVQVAKRLKELPMGKPIVGLCWAAAEILDPRKNRSLNVDVEVPLWGPMAFKPLLNEKQVQEIVGCSDRFTWVNLQHGRKCPAEGVIEMEHKTTMDAAVLVECCDLIVSVDTGIFHLAAAAAKRTLVMCPSLSDWKFGVPELNGDRCWFYPSVKLFRNGSNRIGLSQAVADLTAELRDWRF